MKKTWWICISATVIVALLPVSWQMILKDSTDESRYEIFLIYLISVGGVWGEGRIAEGSTFANFQQKSSAT